MTSGARHIDMCLNHMSKITANDSHRHDDIADTLADAVRMTFIEKSVQQVDNKDDSRKQILQNMNKSFKRKLAAGAARYVRDS